MNKSLLNTALLEIQNAMQNAITKASYNGKRYANGLEAKTALIRSVSLIQNIHEVVKKSLWEEIKARKLTCSVHPPVGRNSPEIAVCGLLKTKKQDLVFSFGKHEKETISEGALMGHTDLLGKKATIKSIVIGVRSQLSSVNKNFGDYLPLDIRDF